MTTDGTIEKDVSSNHGGVDQGKRFSKKVMDIKKIIIVMMICLFINLFAFVYTMMRDYSIFFTS